MAGQINWLAVLVATLSAFAIGAIWFGPKTFYPVWMKAQGRKIPTERIEMTGGETALMFGGTFVSTFIQVATLALALASVFGSKEEACWEYGAIIGFLLSVGFNAFGSFSHRMFSHNENKPFKALKVWLIEVSQDVVSLTVAGAILGAWV